ncbi:MAG: RluA family pseudouridine synthase [Alphaproteobacteria bacterium]
MTLPDLAGRLLYRDALILVLDKPAGIPVHAGPGGGPNLEQGFDALRFGLPRPPALAHRLDRDTSGCLVLGRHRKALRKLGELFRNGRVAKVYWAIVEGAPPAAEGTVDQPLLKRMGRANWRVDVDPAGQAAVTDWRVLGATGGRTWLELRPRTGRTHQIRVHCQWLGCPIVGDPVYGAGGSGPEPLMLHARGLTLPLHASREPIAVEAPPPPHMRPLLRACGWPG